MLPHQMRWHQDKDMSAVIPDAREGPAAIGQFIGFDSVGSEEESKLIMVLNMEVIVKNKILHPSSQLTLHRLENRIIFAIHIR